MPSSAPSRAVRGSSPLDQPISARSTIGAITHDVLDQLRPDDIAVIVSNRRAPALFCDRLVYLRQWHGDRARCCAIVRGDRRDGDRRRDHRHGCGLPGWNSGARSTTGRSTSSVERARLRGRVVERFRGGQRAIRGHNGRRSLPPSGIPSAAVEEKDEVEALVASRYVAGGRAGMAPTRQLSQPNPQYDV